MLFLNIFPHLQLITKTLGKKQKNKTKQKKETENFMKENETKVWMSNREESEKQHQETKLFYEVRTRRPLLLNFLAEIVA